MRLRVCIVHVRVCVSVRLCGSLLSELRSQGVSEQEEKDLRHKDLPFHEMVSACGGICMQTARRLSRQKLHMRAYASVTECRLQPGIL